MNPLRSIREEFDTQAIITLVVCLLIALLGWWATRRQSKGGTGGEGYSPADLRGIDPRRTALDADEIWLLGFAAPYVEHHQLLHDRWGLAPDGPNPAWQRKLGAVLSAAHVVDRGSWSRLVDSARSELAEPSPSYNDASGRAWVLTRYAWLVRLGVAAGHVDADAARHHTLAAATSARALFTNWSDYGDAFLASSAGSAGFDPVRLRADVRTLYAADGPWSDPGWPHDLNIS